jgi:mono/diheme cytochrome c family protein
MNGPFRRALFLTLGLLVSCISMGAQAGEKNLRPATISKAYQTECAACHLAYPPAMLPAQSWTLIMKGLDKHYGANASIDDIQDFKEIADWLQDHAGTYKKPALLLPPDNRISKTYWFVKEHRKIDAQVWLRESIQSPSNCAACHTKADQFDYRERNIRIPN